MSGMRATSSLAVDVTERMVQAAELLEAPFFGGCQLAGSTILNREDVPGRSLGRNTFGCLFKGTVLMVAAAMGPTFRPRPFKVQIPRDFGVACEKHSVEGRGRLQVGNTTHHVYVSGGLGGTGLAGRGKPACPAGGREIRPGKV
jgi:hypothetical protein